jgi:hypothetical protein
MAKIVLTEEQLEKMVKRMVSTHIMSEAPVPIGNPGGMTDDEILAKAAEIKKVRATNASILKPGEKASDYFRNPDGSIKTTDLPGVTVSASRGPAPAIKVPPRPLPNAPTSLPTTAPAITQQKTDVASGPTTPAAQGIELPTVTVTGQTGPGAAIGAAQKPPLPSVTTPTAPGVSGQPAAKQMSGQEMHNLLMQKGLINGLTDMNGYENRRIVYKGAPLSQEQLGTLTKHLVDNGYGGRFSQVPDKRYGQKYVWVKGGNALPSDLAA